jgi:hypothetical protein
MLPGQRGSEHPDSATHRAPSLCSSSLPPRGGLLMQCGPPPWTRASSDRRYMRSQGGCPRTVPGWGRSSVWGERARYAGHRHGDGRRDTTAARPKTRAEPPRAWVSPRPMKRPRPLGLSVCSSAPVRGCWRRAPAERRPPHLSCRPQRPPPLAMPRLMRAACRTRSARCGLKWSRSRRTLGSAPVSCMTAAATSPPTLLWSAPDELPSHRGR